MVKRKTKIAVTGIGWITDNGYGCVKNGIQRNYGDKKSLYTRLCHDSIFVFPVKNFSRFDVVAKMACFAGALAISDAKMTYSEQHKQNIGIIGTNNAGSLASNISYFKDYIENGRTLARGNLFIYTLPTSPLAEAAIHFRYHGPLLYINSPHKQVSTLLCRAGEMLLRKEAVAMLAMKVDEVEGLCFVLQPEENCLTTKLYMLEDALSITARVSGLDEVVQEFSDVNK